MCRCLAYWRTDWEAWRGTEDRVLGKGNKPKEVLENKASDTLKQDLPPAGRSPLPIVKLVLSFVTHVFQKRGRMEESTLGV